MMVSDPGFQRGTVGAVVLAVVATCCVAGLADSSVQNDAVEVVDRHALLIACRDYDASGPRDLKGPRNDVRAFRDLLINRFEFPPGQVELLGDEGGPRSTRANIVGRMANLVSRVKAHSQVFILYAGHGSQVPVSHDGQRGDEETDGKDEILLPVDVGKWSKNSESVENQILDDEMNAWLSQLRAKGAHVFVVFDCCHAGFASRGGSDLDPPRTRSVAPEALGIPIRDSRRGPKTSGSVSNKAVMLDAHSLPASLQSSDGEGSVVALFACQSYEEEPEVDRPSIQDPSRKTTYGLLSYSMVHILASVHRDRPITYRELGQALQAWYRAERGAAGPVPFLEGDLDREVLGRQAWQGGLQSTLLISDGRLLVTTGQLARVAEGSIFAVYPPINSGSNNGEEPLGHVRILQSGPFRSLAEPIAHGGLAQPKLSDLPSDGLCELVHREWGDMRLSVHHADGNDDEFLLRLQAPPDPSADRHGMIRLVGADESPDVVLRTNEDGETLLFSSLTSACRDLPSGGDQVPVGRYRLDRNDADEVGRLRDDLWKLYALNNLWRLLGTAEQTLTYIQSRDLDVSYKIEPGYDGRPWDWLDTGKTVPEESVLSVGVRNTGSDEMWITFVTLEANGGIGVFPQGLLEAGSRIEKAGRVVTESRLPRQLAVMQSFAVLAVPRKAYGNSQPDLMFLQQSPFSAATESVTARRSPTFIRTAFERLLLNCTWARGPSERSGDLMALPDTPIIVSETWVTKKADRKNSEE